MKALVTGATGLVGHAIVSSLGSRGVPTRALVRDLDKARQLLPDSVELSAGDITDPSSLGNALEGCTHVYHAAGLPEQWLLDATRFEQVNVGGTRNMVEAALSAGVVRFAYTSTIDVFASGPFGELVETEIDPEPKGTAYERSKQQADRLVVAALDRGLPAVFLHPAAVYGPGPAGSPGVNDFIERLRDRRLPSLLPGGMPVVFAPDVGEGHVLAAEKATVGERFILCDRYVTLTELARAVARELGREKIPPVVPLPVARLVAAAGEAIASLTKKPPLVPKGQLHFLQWGVKPSNDRARERLGLEPTPLEDGLVKTLDALGRAPRQ